MDQLGSVSSADQDHDEVLQKYIDVLTNQNVSLKSVDSSRLDSCNAFVHTPKHGRRIPEDCSYFETALRHNPFVKDQLHRIDKKYSEFMEGQDKFVRKVWN